MFLRKPVAGVEVNEFCRVVLRNTKNSANKEGKKQEALNYTPGHPRKRVYPCW